MLRYVRTCTPQRTEYSLANVHHGDVAGRPGEKNDTLLLTVFNFGMTCSV